MSFKETTIGLMALIVLVLALFVSLRGLLQLFQRYNSILVIFYIVFLSPIAFLHGLILGVFGKSKKTLEEQEIARLARIQLAVDAKIQESKAQNSN